MKFRRLLAVALVWLVVVPIAVLGPARAADAADPVAAVHDIAGERLSASGSLAAGHAGLQMAFGDLPEICDNPIFADYGICVDDDPEPPPPPPPPPPEEPPPIPTPDYGQLKADAYTEALQDISDNIPVPQMRLWPAVDKFQIVNLDTYLYVESGWSNIAGQGEACDTLTPTECVTVSFTGEPEISFWSFVEANSINPPVEFECERGERQPDALGTVPDCGKSWTNSSDVTGNVEAEMVVRYDITVASSHAAYRTYLNYSFDLESPEPDKETLTVAEVQTYGHSDIDPVPEESEGGLCSTWGVSFVCWVGEKAADAAIWALVNTIPGLEEVWNFFKGCGDGVLEELGGILAILETVGEAISDPEEFIREKLQAMQDLYEAATNDPEAFIEEVLAGVLDLEYLETHTTAEWIGKTACSMAIQYLSGAAGARLTQRLDDFLGSRTPGNNRDNDRDDNDRDGDDRDDDNHGDVSGNPEFDDNWDDDLGPDDYDPDQDPLGPACVANSFPTGTLVLMGDGSHAPIDQIQPGDIVQAYSPSNDTWTSRVVLDQWSYVDTDQMATVTLTDGSQVSATDHHLFWVDDQREWTQAEDLASTDWLLTPGGLIKVHDVDLWPSNETVVWELTVAVDHTFTVAAGAHDVVVHNQDVQGVELADLDANWQVHQANGGTAANWFDSLSAEQVNAIMQPGAAPGPRNRLKSGLRNGGGLHEFFPVSMAADAKRLGLTSADIHAFTISTNDFAGIDPNTGQVFNHKSSTAARQYHEALYEAIRNATDAQDALDRINRVNSDWNVSNMPGATDLYTENDLRRMIDSGELTELEAQQIRDNYLEAFDRDATRIGDADADWSNREPGDPPRPTC